MGLLEMKKSSVEFRCRAPVEISVSLLFLLCFCFAPCNPDIYYFQIHVILNPFVCLDDDSGGSPLWPSAP